MTDGRLALVVTSPRVAPGLLSHGAWEAVAAAAPEVVVEGDLGGHPARGVGAQQVGDVMYLGSFTGDRILRAPMPADGPP